MIDNSKSVISTSFTVEKQYLLQSLSGWNVWSKPLACDVFFLERALYSYPQYPAYRRFCVIFFTSLTEILFMVATEWHCYFRNRGWAVSVKMWSSSVLSSVWVSYCMCLWPVCIHQCCCLVRCLFISSLSLLCCAGANKPIWMHAEEIENSKVSILPLTVQF